MFLRTMGVLPTEQAVQVPAQCMAANTVALSRLTERTFYSQQSEGGGDVPDPIKRGSESDSAMDMDVAPPLRMSVTEYRKE